MPVNYFPNATEAELIALAESLQRRLTVGEVQFITLPGGGQVQRSWQNTESAKPMLLNVLYALHRKNPSTYENPFLGRVQVTYPSYSR